MAHWTRHGLSHTPANRPFTDSEHGPIHMFNDHKKMLNEAFDDEYERHHDVDAPGLWGVRAAECGGPPVTRTSSHKAR